MTAGSRSTRTVASLLDLRVQHSLLRSRIVKGTFLAVSMALIVAQQTSFLLRRENPDVFYRNVINLGANYQKYFAFFYYFGGFPVNLAGQTSGTLDETRATLEKLGAKLMPDRSVYNRASIFLFYPDALLKGRPDTAEMRTGHAVWFTLALVSVFLALCYVEMPLLGLCVALLCGSDAFQVYEIYHMDASTIFPTVISTGLMIVAVCVVLSSEGASGHKAPTALLVCLGGVIGALQYEIRLEGVGVFAGALFSFVVGVRQTARTKIAVACLFLLSVLLTNTLITVYFRSSLAKANAIVVSYGGKPSDIGDPYYSTPWWALWSGLGDFDEKYGFLADDRAGISYYYGQNASRYSEILHRNNYVGTIFQDPAWFAGILRGRLQRVLIHNTPYRLSFGAHTFDLRAPPTLVTALFFGLLATGGLLHRRQALTKLFVNLLVLPLSIGLVAVGQLADYGLQFYCVAHLFIFAYVICFALEGVLALAMWIANGRQMTPIADHA